MRVCPSCFGNIAEDMDKKRAKCIDCGLVLWDTSGNANPKVTLINVHEHCTFEELIPPLISPKKEITRTIVQKLVPIEIF